MTAEPAIAAAQRVNGTHNMTRRDMRFAITAAREALAPLRKLHTRRQKMHNVICDECRSYWPCATAKLIYPEDEL
ncbi:hypothetical protein JTZ10_21550 [Gordonia rubripertincta]|uniref:Uncharacterized protein n=1 Tax=Gordonia rubripertincta TaxID=36822 RepID=A0AAW4GAV8_GORRU|nr:hypothetical protein [Gordonia rubripertincta]MBM7280333.1 hypothetical protein [Gordonia rubripertincta]